MKPRDKKGRFIKGYKYSLNTQFKKGNKISDKMKLKMSIAHKGLKISQEAIKKRSGSKHYNWKGGELKRNCIICNKEFYIKPSHIKRNRGKFCSQKCNSINQKNSFKGKNNPAWRGGFSKTYQENRTERQWNRIRKEVYKRDNWTCQICRKHCHKDIQCHHIIPYRISLNDNQENLITLCKSCHIKEELKYYERKG